MASAEMSDGKSTQSTMLDTPISHDQGLGNSPYLQTMSMQQDPRLSSMHSLVPEEQDEGDQRRKLLLIYIHGFMGNESSFKSFPAHVHNLVTITLRDTHVVHTKIYPHYRSRRPLDVVAEDFSTWLTPHEISRTDLILLGHSMGGLLSGEVVLLKPHPPPNSSAFRHRLIGTINFDVPFLGMHPGIVASGLASLFRPAPSTPDTPNMTVPTNTPQSTTQSNLEAPSRRDTLFSPPLDPNFNRPFANDVNLPVRKGWRSALHFVQKHSDGLRQATEQYVRSHVEFGGAMADYRGLHARYNKMRALEEDEEVVRRKAVQRPAPVPRVRFVNYYTACWGRPKSEKAERLNVEDAEARSRTPSSIASLSRDQSPRMSTEDVRSIEHVPILIVPEGDTAPSPQGGKPEAEIKSASLPTLDIMTTESFMDQEALANSSSTGTESLPIWPPLSPPATEPVAPDYSIYPEKVVQDTLKKEHERRVKAYKQAMKDRETTLAERKKAEEKIRKAAAKQAERNSSRPSITSTDQRLEEDESATAGIPSHSVALPERRRSSPQSGTPQLSESDTRHPPASRHSSQPEPKMKEKHFCVLPPKDDAGERDLTWVRIFMQDMDEVTAHTSLFIISDAYEMLVGDVGTRIEEWIRQAGM